MKGLSLIAQFNFQRAADVAIPKTPLESRIPFRGQKSRAPNLLPLLGISGSSFETRLNYRSRRRLSTLVILLRSLFLRIRKNTARISTSVELARVFLKKILLISCGIQQGFPPATAWLASEQERFTRVLRQQLVAITSNKNLTPAHHDCCCGREWRKTGVCKSPFPRPLPPQMSCSAHRRTGKAAAPLDDSNLR